MVVLTWEHTGTVADAHASPATRVHDSRQECEQSGSDSEDGKQFPANSPSAVLCEQCGAAAFKYRCPGCLKRSCSLDCVRAHKADTACSGQRNRTAFVSMQNFDDRTLMSDFQLLEEMGRVDDVARRCRPPRPSPMLPPHLAKLVYHATRRGVKLLIMPPGMAKRKSNTSWHDARRLKMQWRVEWRFPSAGIECVNERVDDDSVLGEVLAAHMRHPAPNFVPLRPFAKMGVDKLRVFMRKEKTPANRPAFFPIDVSQPLHTQLANRTIIEFPVFIVVLPHEAAGYPPLAGAVTRPTAAVPPPQVAAATADTSATAQDNVDVVQPGPSLERQAMASVCSGDDSVGAARPGGSSLLPTERTSHPPCKQPSQSHQLHGLATAPPVKVGGPAAAASLLAGNGVSDCGGRTATLEEPASKRQRLEDGCDSAKNHNAPDMASEPRYKSTPAVTHGGFASGFYSAAVSALAPLAMTGPAQAAPGGSGGSGWPPAAGLSGTAGAVMPAGLQFVGCEEAIRDTNEIELEDDEGSVDGQLQRSTEEEAEAEKQQRERHLLHACSDGAGGRTGGGVEVGRWVRPGNQGSIGPDGGCGVVGPGAVGMDGRGIAAGTGVPDDNEINLDV